MSGNTENILDIKNIEVVYDNVILALHNVSLQVPKGKVVALLVANGAGKSTTLKMITGYLSPTSGNVFVDEMDIITDCLEIQKMVGSSNAIAAFAVWKHWLTKVNIGLET